MRNNLTNKHLGTRGSGSVLCYFSVENFQSIKNQATLDMRATNIKDNKQKLLIDQDSKEFLPTAVIYGPNASGKSTVLYALYALGCKIMLPIYTVKPESFQCNEVDKGLTIKPFAFDSKTRKSPTTFVLSFRTDSTEYEYELRLCQDLIVYERLIKKTLLKGRYSLVFLREEQSISLKGDLKGFRVTDLSDNITLLSYFGILYRKNPLINDIITWFAMKFDYLSYSDPINEAFIRMTEKKENKDIMLKMFNEMDIGISDFRIVHKDDDMDVFTTHKINEDLFELTLEEESSGTQKLFGLLATIIESLRFGKTVLIDELDAKLHPVLLQYIIDLFKNKDSNLHNSQLIFTSHDITSMNSKNFRRDEIWFTAKGVDNSTTLYSLADFVGDAGTKIRNDERYDKRYLEGRYGATPSVLKLIDWKTI